MTKVFGSTLRTLRKSKGVSQATLSAEFKVASGGSRLSKTTIHNLEQGVNNTRLDRHKISALATALGLSNHETQQLFEAAGYSADSELLITRVTNAVQSLIDSVGNQAQPFVAQIEQLANRYKLSMTQQSEGVSVLLIPIAGWQAQVLADELIERMLVPALEEATNAGIKEVVLIVAPGKGSKWKFDQQFRPVSIRRVEQENASGLGGALATGRPENTFSPIAVLLPDEVDEKRRALSDMVQEFRKVKKPLIGVYPRATSREELTLLKQYGVVGLKTNTGPRSGRTWQLSQPLIEKPQTRDELPQENRKVAGRYIFTAEVFDIIQLLAPNLTTAINYNWDLFRAFELRDELTSLAPYKQILELKFVRVKP